MYARLSHKYFCSACITDLEADSQIAKYNKNAIKLDYVTTTSINKYIKC